MSMQRPLEGLLRPPLEWYSSLMSLTAAGMLWVYSDNFLLPSEIISVSSLGLIGFSLIRFKQGYRIWRYKRHLKKMPVYLMSSQELPVSQKKLFLGRGFLWTPLHTQRLRDLDLSYNLKYRYPSGLYQLARRLEFTWENKFILTHLLKKDSLVNPVRPYPDIGGEPCLHGVSEVEENISLSLIERAGHVVVIGTTGVGKTRLAELLTAQDIHRGDVVIVLDPKGDADLLMRIYSEAKLAGREDDLLIFHLAFPEFSCRYNAIGNFTKLTQVATRLTNGLPSTGNAAAFKEFAWKYVNLVAKALVAMGLRPTYKLINFYITKLDQLLVKYCEEIVSKNDIDYKKWITAYIQNIIPDKNEPTRKEAILAYAKKYLDESYERDINSIQNDLLIDLFSACKLDKTYYDKITASIGPLLEKLTTGEIAELLSPNYSDLNDERPLLDWLQVIRNKKIVYIGMDALTDTEIASTVGNAMLSDLVSVAGHLYNFGLDHGFEGIVGKEDKENKESEENEKNKENKTKNTKNANKTIKENKKNKKTPLPRVCLHSDEFNEVIGDEFIPILNKARGAGFNVVAYTQTWSDVEARLESTAKAGQVAGNLNTVIMFRTKEAKTVDMLLNQLPTVPILRVIPASSSSDSPYGDQGVFYQSSNEDRFTHTEAKLIEQNDVLNLPKGQAFCLMEGGKLYKIRVPLPNNDNTFIASLPSSINELVKKMRERIGGVNQENNKDKEDKKK